MRSTAPRIGARSIASALLLSVVSCGGSDPQQILEQLASSAATAQLAIAERASGAITERYASQLLEKTAESASRAATQLDAQQSLSHDTKSRALLIAMQVASASQRAASDTASARSTARTLDSLAHDAGWLAEHAAAPR